MEGWIDWTRTAQSPNYRGAHSFATFMIIGPTCFFLGILFAAFPYDFPLLWTTHPVADSYYDQLETHLRFIHSAPPLIGRMLNIAIVITLVGFLLKLLPQPSQANFLFDGAGLTLFLIGVGVYRFNIVDGLRAVRDQAWPAAAPGPGAGAAIGYSGDTVPGREESLRLLAMSNTILALVLVGVLVLQAGQWYTERKEHDDLERIAAERRDSRSGGSSRKRQ